MTYEIGFAIITFAWVVLVIYLVLTLIELRKFLRSSQQSIIHIDSMLQPISSETTKILKTSNMIADNLIHKAEDLNPLFETLANVKNSVSDVFSSKGLSSSPQQVSPSNATQDWIELTALGVLLWQKFKNKEFVHGKTKDKPRKFSTFK
jgi:uncharacterized protein YoxC